MMASIDIFGPFTLSSRHARAMLVGRWVKFVFLFEVFCQVRPLKFIIPKEGPQF